MKKGLFTLVIVAAVSGLVGCDSGDDGGGGGNTAATGTATLSGLTYASASNYCFSTTAIGTAASCSVGGTPSNQTSSATCSAGTASVTCQLGGLNYVLATTGSDEVDRACAILGGTVKVTCPILTSGACTSAGGTWTAANVPNVSNASNCAAAGGTFYTTLKSITGSLADANLTTNKNIISANPTEVATVLNLINGVSDLDNTNPSVVAMTATASIGGYWEYPFYMSSGSVHNFRSTTVEFSAVSPVATSVAITIKANSAKVYFQ